MTVDDKRGDSAHGPAGPGSDPHDAYRIGLALAERGELDGAEAAFRSADERGHPAGAYRLGLVLATRGDMEGAEAAYRRADERGDGAGAANLGILLKKRGDLEAAESACRRADERGEPAGTSILGALLEQRGDIEGAEAAYRRADERGDGLGAANLGNLLRKRSDFEGAAGAYRRADERGSPIGSYNLGVLLGSRGDLDGAEAAYRRADERGIPAGSSNLGMLLQQRGDLEGAEAAYRRADEQGNAEGATNLGVLLQNRNDLSGAESAYRRADERGEPVGSLNLGVLLAHRNDSDGAAAAYRRADERGSALGTLNLGLMLAKRGDHDGAAAIWASADKRGFVSGAIQLGLALAREMNDQGRPPLAERIARRVTELEPRSAEAFTVLATALTFQGKDAEADDTFRYALELDLNSRSAPGEGEPQPGLQSSIAESTHSGATVKLQGPHRSVVWLRRIWNGIWTIRVRQRRIKPRLNEEEFAAVRSLAERLTYDFVRLIAGHDVPDFPLQSDHLERLRAQVEPFLAAGQAFRPTLGDYGNMTVEGSPDLSVFIRYTDFSCRTTDVGGSFCPRPRHIKLTFAASSPYNVATSFDLQMLYGREGSAVFGTKPDSLETSQEPPPPSTRRLGDPLKILDEHHRCKAFPNCERTPLGTSEKCLEHVDRSQLSDTLATHSGAIDARGMTIDSDMLDTVIRSRPNRAFGTNVRFDHSSFVGHARFDGCRFTSRASFEAATFQQSASFVGTTFAHPTEFGGCRFLKSCSFEEARFYGAALFDSVEFTGPLSFAGANFHGGASFGRSNFLKPAEFTRCWFRRDVRSLFTMYITDCVSFAGAVFESAPIFDDVRVSGTCVFDGALFNSADVVELPIVCRALSLVDAQFLGGVDLLLRPCEVILDGANFAKSSRLTTAGEQASRFEARSLRDRNSERLERVRLVSLRGARVGELVLDEVDLRACHFDGASGLDRLRIEGSESFAVGPAGWARTERPVLAEEWEWRAYGHRGGPKVSALGDVIVSQPATKGGKGWADIPSSCRRSPLLSESPGPIPRRKIVSIYRDLRKGREDNRDELNAADFYYSEMLMRSQRDHSSVLAAEPAPSIIDRVLLRIFWAVSGYDVRPIRSLAAFLLTVVGFALALVLWGYKHGPGMAGIADALITSVAAATLFSPLDTQRLTLLGQAFVVILRLLGPILLALTALGIRSRARR